MDNSIIEISGISYLNIFLGKTKIIQSQVNQRDKYPIWDGEIILYKSQLLSAKNLYCRVPVQVKSEYSEAIEDRDKISYPVDKKDLEKYSDDGGILFIKVIFNNNDVNKIYARLLLKGDIQEILELSKSESITKNIDLYFISNPEEIVTICKNYKIHSKLQAQIPTELDIKNIGNTTELVSYTYIDSVKDLVVKEQYAYAKIGYNILAYVGKFKNKSLSGVIHISAETNKKKYYNEIIEIITENEHFYMIGKYVKLMDNKLIICNNLINDNIVLTINDLEFVCDLLENKNLLIGSVNTTFTFDTNEDINEKINIVKSRINYFKRALSIIRKLGLSEEKAKINKIIDDEKLVCDIRNIVIDHGEVSLKNEKNKFVNVIDVLNQKYLIYFIKDDISGSYRGYNFITDKDVLNHLVVEEENTQLSRYYNLGYDILANVNLDIVNFKREMKSVTKNSITISFISVLMLELIKCYDVNRDDKYIKLAEFINKLIRNCEGYSEDYYLINKYQMLKRKGSLSADDRNQILKIKISNPNDLKIICACNLLCDSLDEYKLYFEQMSEDDKKMFKTWSICNLLINKNNRRN